jgi:hypothetical protein
MNSYELLLFAHILRRSHLGGRRALHPGPCRAGAGYERPAGAGLLAHEVEWIGLRVFLPASIVLLLSGIGLVLEGDWGFSTMWVLLGLAAYALSVVTGALVSARERPNKPRSSMREVPEAKRYRTAYIVYFSSLESSSSF